MKIEHIGKPMENLMVQIEPDSKLVLRITNKIRENTPTMSIPFTYIFKDDEFEYP